MRSLTVDFTFLIGFDLDVDTGNTFRQADEIGMNALFGKSLLNGFSGKARRKAQRRTFQSQLG